MVSLRAGDVLAGTLGTRRALRGYAGVVPPQHRRRRHHRRAQPGRHPGPLHLGRTPRSARRSRPRCWAPSSPFPSWATGSAGRRTSATARCRRPTRSSARVPVVYVAGTCMNAGKTVAATELVRGLSRGGLRVAAAKLTGVSLMRDALSHARRRRRRRAHLQRRRHRQHPRRRDGADAPRASSTGSPAAKPDVIVAELGDGILGEYGVQDILRDPELMAVRRGLRHGGARPGGLLGRRGADARSEYGLPITAITGPATDNEVGQVTTSAPGSGSRRTTRGATPRAWSPRCATRWPPGAGARGWPRPRSRWRGLAVRVGA